MVTQEPSNGLSLPVSHFFSMDHSASILGFGGSLGIVLGLGLLLRRASGALNMSIPESAALACLVLLGLSLLSRLTLETAVPGFKAASALGLCGWLVVIVSFAMKFKKARRGSFRYFFHENPLTRDFRGIPGKQQWLAITCLVIIFLSLCWSLLMSVIVVPDDWDAWAIWGPKAKVLALGVGPLSEVIWFGHADYPLLWPAVWGLSGWSAGGWEEQWSRAWGPVFLLLCIWQMTVVTQRWSGEWTSALLPGALFASVPMVSLLASWSYAEAPFWLMSVCAFGCLLRSQDT